MKDYKTWQRWETDFDGQKVSMDLKRLPRKLLTKIIPLMGKFQHLDQTEEKDMQAMLDITDEGAELIIENVSNIEGFTIDGQSPQFKDIAFDAEFTQLVIQAMTELVNISVMKGSDEKN